MELGRCCLSLSLSDNWTFWPEVVAHTLNFQRQRSPYCARSELHLIPKNGRSRKTLVEFYKMFFSL